MNHIDEARGQHLIQSALAFLNLSPDRQQLRDMLDYINVNQCPAFHAISAVMGTCCNCVACNH